MDKQALKLKTLEECPNLAFFDELQALNGKIESIKSVLKEIKGKESKTYEEEITSLQETLNSLLKTTEDKETIVNIPLDKLEISLARVEKAIREIKEVKIPEFPKEIKIDNEQLDNILESFEKIPEFPVEELAKAVDKLLRKIDELKKEDEIFDYERVERKMDLIVKAVKDISITVSGGSGKIGAFQTLTTTADDLQSKEALVTASALFGRINGAIKPILIDKGSQSLVTIDFSHSKIHAGEHFYRKDWVDIGGSATVDFLIVVPVTTEIPHMDIVFSFEAEANIIVYEATTASTNGTELSTFNRNRNSTNTPKATLYSAPTVTAEGNIIARYKAGSGKSAGGEIRAEAELMLKTNTKYLVRVVNDTVTANWCDYLADWYEQTPLN